MFRRGGSLTYIYRSKVEMWSHVKTQHVEPVKLQSSATNNSYWTDLSLYATTPSHESELQMSWATKCG